MNEIGSIFDLDISYIGKDADIDIKGLSIEKLKRYQMEFLFLGRHSIRLSIIAALKKSRDIKRRALLPVYTCWSVVDSFEKENFEISFYDINKDLSTDVKDLTEKIEEFEPSIVLINSYFGFNNSSISDELVIKYQKMGIYFIEDITQSIFSKIKISPAQFIVGSIRKWMPIPDGAVFINRNGVEEEFIHEVISNEESSFPGLMLEAMDKRRQFLSGKIKNRQEVRESMSDAESALLDLNSIHFMSEESKFIFNRYDIDSIKKKRKENYEYLYSKVIEKLSYVKPVTDEKVSSCVPLYFPTYVEDREKVQKLLAEKGIFCPIIWGRPNAVKDEFMTENSKYMYSRMLCIPCDQRYNIEDMKRILEELIEIEGKIYK